LSIPFHSRQAASHNLDLIEDVWRIMKQQIKAHEHFSGTIQEISNGVHEECDERESDHWNGYCSLTKLTDYNKWEKLWPDNHNPTTNPNIIIIIKNTHINTL